MQRCDFRTDLNVLKEDLFCSSGGRLFNRIIERGKKKPEREDNFLTRGTGYDSFLKVCPELCDGDGNSSVKLAGKYLT